jgi:hypothetical protein
MTRAPWNPKRLAIAAALTLALTLSTLSHAETIQRAGLRVTVKGELTPQTLPRHGTAPIQVSIATKIAASDGGDPPQLRKIELAINRNGRFDSNGLPKCIERDIQPATTQGALAACGASLIGTGYFSAKVLFKQQVPYPAEGKLYAFSGSSHGKPAILAHVYGKKPVPTSFTFPFVLQKTKGTFGTVLSASFPQVTGNAGYVTGISLKLGKVFKVHGKTHSFLSASCPAPKGFPGASFPLAKATLSFPGKTLSSTLARECRARG